ncbi:MAG: RNA pseudouridine synthase [Pelagibacteraceae bacterium]|nr:RNA pseudouridine synthase [Pelagibacteraceae bacterium]PPR47305.1 MAG: Ribosomal large subunit pseudouridine synthase D [Alphaproteobacteria bacterium MarineAlpha5_Bin9]|tara:strand:+ start:9718 stop:10689 length:972 start_codon:yes stop_codon:yes gene_type:complete
MQNYKIIKVIIDNSQNNQRLDVALANNISTYSRSQIKLLLLDKKVKISNKIINNISHKVKTGEIYTLYSPVKNFTHHKPQNIPLDIHYEDKDIIIINKNSGIVTHPAPGNYDNTLVNALIYHTKNKLSNINETNRPGIVHRLDKDTSGLLVIAKNNDSHKIISDQFKKHSITRKYLAIVWGIPNIKSVSGYINRHHINRKKMSLNKNLKGKYSETIIKLIKSYGICSLIECELKTGRTHQVRVHMNSVNHPLIGDKTYGLNKTSKYGKEKKFIKKYLICKNFKRQALHAAELGFVHPKTKKFIYFKSKVPKDMLDLLDNLSKY